VSTVAAGSAAAISAVDGRCRRSRAREFETRLRVRRGEKKCFGCESTGKTIGEVISHEQCFFDYSLYIKLTNNARYLPILYWRTVCLKFVYS